MPLSWAWSHQRNLKPFITREFDRTIRKKIGKKFRYFRLTPNLAHRKLIDLANFCLVPAPIVFELHATIFQKLRKLSVRRGMWRLLKGMKACMDEFQPNTSQANYFEGFWNITSKTNVKIEVRKQQESMRANRQVV